MKTLLQRNIFIKIYLLLLLVVVVLLLF